MGCEFSKLERSREEEIELQRSTKKVKEDNPPISSPSSPTNNGNEPFYYKAKLVGGIPEAYAQTFNFHVNLDKNSYSDDEVENLFEGVVAIKLSIEKKM